MSEADERLPVGPRGVQGTKGERGERGLSLGTGRAVVVLFFIMVAFGASNWYWSAHETAVDNRNWHQAVAADNAHWRQALAETQQKFCGVVGGVTSVPVARPADPKANPSRETSWEWYQKFVRLATGLGCESGA